MMRYRSGVIMKINNGFAALLLKSPQKGSSVPASQVGRLVVSDSMGFRRFSSSTCLGGGGPIPTDHVSYNQFPGLMVPENDENSETRSFLRFNHDNGSFEKDIECNPLPVPHRYVCCGSAYGWVFLIGDNLNTKIMNPFSGEEMLLPSVKTLPQPPPGWMGMRKQPVLKAAFSSDPSLLPSPIVMVIHVGEIHRLAYCKPGDDSWTSLHQPHFQHIFEHCEDIIFYIDRFYAISKPGYIMAVDIGRLTDDNDHSVRKTIIAPDPEWSMTKAVDDHYLVVLDGEIVKISRKTSGDKDHDEVPLRFNHSRDVKILDLEVSTTEILYLTYGFIVERFVGQDKWVELDNLGDNALFLGKNSSFALKASEHPGCIQNAVYFTDCNSRQDQDFGYDMGVYNLSDRSMEPLYPVGSGLTEPPPVMVTRPRHITAGKGSLIQRLVVSAGLSSSSAASAEMGSSIGSMVKTASDCLRANLGQEEKRIQAPKREISSTKVSLNQFPGLMVHGGMVENSTTRRPLSTGYFEQDVAAAVKHDHSRQHNEQLQVPHGHVCRGSAYGWLFLTDDNLDMKLLNPFSGAEIQLPPMNTLPRSNGMEERLCPLSKWFVSKAVFSADPSVEPRPVVLVIYAGERTPRLAFCKPGDETWTPLGFPIKMHFEWCFVFPTDAIYHKGEFYVLGLPGYVAAFDIGRRIDDADHSVKTTLVATAAKKKPTDMRDSYLAVLDGEFVRFELKTTCFRDYCIYGYYDEIMEVERMRDGDTTDGIKIWRFGESEKQWVKVESLGDKAVFLGYNTSFALSASDHPAALCIPNSIYFTYGEGGYARTEKVCYDVGIYNVKDESVKPLYPPMDDDSDASQSMKPAPIWIVNSADK